MPPKIKTLEELVASLTGQLETITNQLTEVRNKQDEQANTLTRLEGLIKAAQEENTQLRTENAKVKEEMTVLKERINHLEQRNRADCVRIFDLPLPGNQADNNYVAGQVYQKVLLPILRGAVDKGRFESVPPIEEVIGRFKNNHTKVIVLQHKKEFAARAPPPGRGPPAPLPLPHLRGRHQGHLHPHEAAGGR